MLTELAVRDRDLTYEEVESVLSTFASRPASLRLTILCLNVRTLSLPLLDLLAQELPCLLELSLYALESWTDCAEGHDEVNWVRQLVRHTMLSLTNFSLILLFVGRFTEYITEYMRTKNCRSSRFGSVAMRCIIIMTSWTVQSLRCVTSEV
jgi:hypothetical protein